MPAKSQAQQRLMALALHHPEQVHAKNRGVTEMSAKSLRDFASTRVKKLPKKVKRRG